MSSGDLLAWVAELVALAGATVTILAYNRYSKRQIETRMKRIEAKLGEVSSLICLQEPSFSRPLP